MAEMNNRSSIGDLEAEDCSMMMDISSESIKRYPKEELLSLRLTSCDEVTDYVHSEFPELSIDSQNPNKRHPRRRQKSRKKKQQYYDDAQTLAPGLSLILNMEDPCYEELPSTFSKSVAEEKYTADNLSAEEQDYVDDSDGDYGILKPAFFVEGEPDFESGPPQDGLEYLRRVRWETAQIPKVKIAQVDPNRLSKSQTAYMPNIPAVPSCASELLPSNEREKEFLADFSNLRLEISDIQQSSDFVVKSLPPHRNEALWKNFCFGHSTEDEHLQEKVSEDKGDNKDENLPVDLIGENKIFETNAMDFSSAQASEMEASENEPMDFLAVSAISRINDALGKLDNLLHGSSVRHNANENDTYLVEPLLSDVLSLDEVSRAKVFQYHVGWLENENHLSKEKAAWLFALSAVLDKPLDAETCAAVRSLFRKCCILRATKIENDDELSMLNILITISGKYFGQAGI